MAPLIDVSVVIVNYNGVEALQLTIPSLLGQQRVNVTEITLVDNQSTDVSVETVRRQFPMVRIINTGFNRGPNPARNLGVRNATAPLVLVMDNDLVLAPDYIVRLAAVFQDHPDAGAVSGIIRFHHDPSIVQYNGVDIHYIGEVCLQSLEARDIRRCATVSAGAMLVRKSLVEQVGWFDEDFVFGWEDGDFAFRLSLAGFPCWVDSGANALHLSQKRGMKWIKYQVRNRWWFIRKNYDHRTFCLCLPAFILFNTMIGAFCLLQGNLKPFVQGVIEGVGNGAEIREKHRAIQRMRRVLDRDLLCGQRMNLPGNLNRHWIGRMFVAGVCFIFHGYWRIIRPLLRRELKPVA